jgi:hypothetical protein
MAEYHLQPHSYPAHGNPFNNALPIFTLLRLFIVLANPRSLDEISSRFSHYNADFRRLSYIFVINHKDDETGARRKILRPNV